MSDSWSLTESDPAVFTGLLHGLGVKGLEVEELYGLDQTLLQELHPVYALIFLFKWVGSSNSKRDGMHDPNTSFYFAKQVINNACASIAIINAVMNIHDESVTLGDELDNLNSFSQGLDSETCGWTISNSEKIRQVHNSFAKSDPYSLEEAQSGESEDAYHFIAYLPIDGKLYELDGLTSSPILHSTLPDPENWLVAAKEVIERRISTYPDGQVMFSLMGITGRASYLTRQVADLESQMESAPSDSLRIQLDETRTRLERVKEQFAEWDFDTQVRQHNHIGLIHSLLLTMAKENALTPQIEVAKESMKKKAAEQKAKGKAEEDLMDD